MLLNKKKIINDPVYGFVKISSDLVFDLIEHPFFQRLRRIQQLGLSGYVYPGALHTRFHHALGAMHLMGLALESLRNKGHEISDQEFEASQIAILLHDIGHGPMSHGLEHILTSTSHEQISLLFMEQLNKEFNGAFEMAISIFKGTYERKFFHQLVSSQLDVDRLDYLQRDCFFTGVSEGTIGADRIIKMLSVHNGELVVEEKGIYSIENFLTARRLMYWQVYLHKTNISAEQMLVQLVTRLKHLIQKDKKVVASPNLLLLLQNSVNIHDLRENPTLLQAFANLDDVDIWSSVKQWSICKDKVLSTISRMLLDRKLFQVTLSSEKYDSAAIEKRRKAIAKHYNISNKQAKYFVVKGSTANEAYLSKGDNINIISKQGKVADIAQASDLPNIKALRKIVKKYYVCWARC